MVSFLKLNFMKKWNLILTSTMIVIFILACSKDKDNSPDLANLNATYVQLQSPVYHKETLKAPEGLITETWGYYMRDYFSGFTLPDNQLKIGSHVEYFGIFDDYLYCNVSIEWYETIKFFLLFKNNGTCQSIGERHVKNLIITRQYVGCSFYGNPELEAKYAQELQLIGTTETSELNESYGNRTIENDSYAVSSYEGTSDNGADFYMYGGTNWVDLFIISNTTINPVQKLPGVQNWGEYVLSETETPSYF